MTMPSIEKMNALAAAADAESAGADSVPETTATAPPAGDVSGAESASADASTTPSEGESASPEATNERATHHELLMEKLRQTRANRRAVEHARQAKAERAAAERARAELEAQKAKWEKIGREGSYLDGLKELGRDPAEEFRRMQDEAVRAGTPEAQMQAMQAMFEKKIAEEVAPLRQKLDATEKELAAARAAEREARIVSQFQGELGNPDNAPLLEEYDPDELATFAVGLHDDPQRTARQVLALGLDLRPEDGKFTMKQVFAVLRATQQAHLQKKARRTSAAPGASQASPAPVAGRPTVNGTAARPAVTTIGNDLAASRASAPQPPARTRQERIEELARRYG